MHKLYIANTFNIDKLCYFINDFQGKIAYLTKILYNSTISQFTLFSPLILVLAQKMMYLYFFVKPRKKIINVNDHFCNFNSSDNAFQIRTCTLNKYLNNRLLLGEKYLRNHFKYVTLQC